MALHDAGTEWWRTGVLYHIYPRSFQDSNGDGVGDIAGILQRLDHLAGAPGSLGVDGIWLSPVYPSPMADFGYDVADYTGVDARLGSLNDLDRLIEAGHQRGLRLILDFVVNHTSEIHPWFVEARSARSSPKRDWYVWHDGRAGGGPPNNWESAFGGPAWTFDQATGQYYLHSFLPQQPDLNWRNPDVVSAMRDVARFWLSRGVDGFRLDAIGRLMKDPSFADNPVGPPAANGNTTIPANNHLHPDLPAALHPLRSVVDEFPGRVTIGEVYARPRELARLYGENGDGLHMLFNFGLIRGTERGSYTPWRADVIASVLRDSEQQLPGGVQACFQISNLDVARFASRHNDDGLGHLRARAGALILLGLHGTPCLYYGDEIGMADVPVPPDRQQDPAGRDPARTPMPWDASPHHGFTTGAPWLPPGPAKPNVADQRDDPGSIFSLYREALAIRRKEPSLHSGALRIVHATTDTLLFERTAPGSPVVCVAMNTSSVDQQIPLNATGARLLLATDPGCQVDSANLVMPPLAAAWLTLA
jgi:alpha-glucosidase